MNRWCGLLLHYFGHLFVTAVTVTVTVADSRVPVLCCRLFLLCATYTRRKESFIATWHQTTSCWTKTTKSPSVSRLLSVMVRDQQCQGQGCDILSSEFFIRRLSSCSNKYISVKTVQNKMQSEMADFAPVPPTGERRNNVVLDFVQLEKWRQTDRQTDRQTRWMQYFTHLQGTK